MSPPRRLLLAAALLAVVSPACARVASAQTIPAQRVGALPSPAASPSPVSARATASQTELTVGEPFAIELTAVGPPGATFSFPGETVAEGFELRPAAPAPGAPPPAPGVRRYEAALFALGDVEIPALPVRYRLSDGTQGETATQPLALKVRSSLPKAAEERKLVEIRGPVAVSVSPAFWVVLGALVALAAALLFWLARRRRQVAAPFVAVAPELPPAAEALRALDALAASDWLPRGEYRAFYIQLTAVAKRYLERRLAAPILEMTSAETLAFLRGHPHGGELVSAVRDLAAAADRIKFARGGGLHEEASRHLAAVRALVGSLEQRLEPAPAASQAA